MAVGSLLTASTVPLTERAVRAIQNAAPLRVDVLTQRPMEGPLSEALGIPRERIREALSQAESAAVRESQDQVRQRQDEALRTLLITCLIVILVFVTKYFFTRGQTYYLSKAATRLAADLRLKLFNHMQRLPVTTVGNKRVGSLQSVLTNDVNVYQTAVNMIRDSIDGPFKAVAALVAMFVIQWQLALIAILFIPVLAWFVHRNGLKMKADQARVQEDLGSLAVVTQEALSGLRVVKAFAAETRVYGMFSKLVETTFDSQVQAIARFAQLRPMVELIGAVSLALILYICGHLARAGDLQISHIVALTLALDIINQGARSLANVNNTYNQVQAAADRIYREVLDLPLEVDGDDLAVLPDPMGRVEFRNVSFQYPDGTQALRNVSFVLEPGESLALVGPSGAGKSTIADLVLKFYHPTEGQVLFDGVDVRELRTTWLRSQFGVVPQHTFLFAGSIEDNLRLGAPEATEGEMWDALETAHAKPFVESMPARLLSEVGERGTRLSGGEGQRLAIARAVIRKPKVLVLDEATSNLDPVSEGVVTQALGEVMEGRTALFIAHRLSTAARATRILVLRKGEVLEIGTHQELLAAQGAYAAMYRAFTSGVMDEPVG